MIARSRCTLLLLPAGIAILGSILGFAETLLVGKVETEPETVVSLPISLADGAAVGFQLDVIFPENQANLGGVNDATEDTAHGGTSRKLSDERYRIIVDSPFNVGVFPRLILNADLSLLANSPDGGSRVSLESLILTEVDRKKISAAIAYSAPGISRRRYNVNSGGRYQDNEGRSDLGECSTGGTLTGANFRRRIQGMHEAEAMPVLTLLYRRPKGRTTTEMVPLVSRDVLDWAPDRASSEPTGIFLTRRGRGWKSI